MPSARVALVRAFGIGACAATWAVAAAAQPNSLAAARVKCSTGALVPA